MARPDPKADLHRYLQDGCDAVLWKLHGLMEHDIRRPVVPTATNLLGVVKHLAGIELGYFGVTFGRPFDEPLMYLDYEAEANADMWATADETRTEIIDRYRRIWEHADSTIADLDIDSPGYVPLWPRPDVKLFNILVHVLTETNRHASHADILREQLDGVIGTGAGRSRVHE